jgi:hypothetical protein
MAIKAKILGREELTRRLASLVPEAITAAEVAKLEVVQVAAVKISAAAPRETGDYARSITGGYQRDNPTKRSFNGTDTKDPDATGIYGSFLWRFLEFGTRAHTNQGRFAGTWHPGTAAQAHIFPVWREEKPKAKRKIANAINKAVRRAMGK